MTVMGELRERFGPEIQLCIINVKMFANHVCKMCNSPSSMTTILTILSETILHFKIIHMKDQHRSPGLKKKKKKTSIRVD